MCAPSGVSVGVLAGDGVREVTDFPVLQFREIPQVPDANSRQRAHILQACHLRSLVAGVQVCGMCWRESASGI